MKTDNLFILFTILAMGLAYTATDIYLPALPFIQHYFSVSINQTQYTLTAYLLGLAISQMFAGPIIDHFRCRKILLPSLAAFIVTTFFCAFAPNITVLIIARFLQAFLAGITGITARASIVRRFDSKRAASIFMTLSPTLILSGVIAPFIGGYIIYYFNWQSVFIFLMLYSVVLLGGIYKYFHINKNETSKDHLNIHYMLQTYARILKHKAFIQCLLINGIYLGLIFSYLTEAPFIYHLGGYTAKEIGLTFIPIALAFLLASQLIRFLHQRFNMNQFVALAFVLIMAGVGLMLLATFTQFKLILMTIGITIAVFGMGFSSPVAFGKGMTLFPQYSGSASSLLTALPFIFSTILTIVVHPICGNNITYLALFLGAIASICVSGYYLLELKRSSNEEVYS